MILKEAESYFKVNKEKEYTCSRCRDTGYIVIDGIVNKCPDCVLGTKGVLLDEDTINDISIDIIPEIYRGILFDANKIKNDARIESNIKSDTMFDYYLDQITNIYDKINIGELLNYSVLIIAPQGLGKAHFVYSCMNAGIRNGLSVAPYYDCLEIYDFLNIVNDGRYKFKQKQNAVRDILDTIYTSDLCFIKMPTGLTIQVNSTQTLKLIVDRRARRGLGTIVTSRFPVSYIYKTEVNLDRFIVTSNYGDAKYDYSRLRVITSPMIDLVGYANKYMYKKKSNWS